MAFFKFRKGGDDSPAAAPQAESVEALRRRARHRLIGAAVLVLLGLVGFPLLFDTQPRPVSVDIPIDIPDRNNAKPLPAPVAAPKLPPTSGIAAPVASASASANVAAAPVASGSVSTEPPVAAEPRVEAKAQPAASQPVETPPVAAAPPAAAPTPAATKPQGSPAKVAPPERNSARAQALLEGKPVQVATADAATGRFVVQVGAFADAGKARETRQRVEKAGLKTYTHVAETKDGRRIRVRVGPFATRAEADKAAGRLKDLDLPAAVLTL